MLTSISGLTRKRYLRRVEPLANIVRMSYGLHIFWSFRLVLWHRADILWWVFGYCPLSSYPGFLEPMLCALGSCYDGGCVSDISFLLDILLDIAFFTVYGRWELKLRYCPVKVFLQYTDDLNPCSVRVTITSSRGNLLSCYFSIVNCIDGLIEFSWSSYVWISSWRGQRMNVSSTYQ